MTPTTPAPRRLEPDARADSILSAAITVAQRDGYPRLTCSAVGKQAGVSTGLVLHYYSADSLRAAVIAYAIKHEILQIIGEAIVNRCKHVIDCSPALRSEAMVWMSDNH